MPDVPVPEIASVSESGPDLNDRGKARANAVEDRHHVGVEMAENRRAIARITRGETGLGPGPKSSRSVDGSMKTFEQRADFLDGVDRQRAQRRARIAADVAGNVERGLEAGNPEAGRHGARERRQALLQGEPLRQAVRRE